MLQRSAGLYNQRTCQCTAQQGGINTLSEGKFNNINPAGTESFFKIKLVILSVLSS